MEARDERRLIKLQRELQAVKLLIIDELGYVHGSTIVTSNLPFEEWTSVLGSERLTGALLDRLTHHVHILSMNGDSYRLAQSTARRRLSAKIDQAADADRINPETGEILPA
jgi:DNA replication protein DnaC